jgi:hypothetical protein
MSGLIWLPEPLTQQPSSNLLLEAETPNPFMLNGGTLGNMWGIL